MYALEDFNVESYIYWNDDLLPFSRAELVQERQKRSDHIGSFKALHSLCVCGMMGMK
jgi:hypothetical protein